MRRRSEQELKKSRNITACPQAHHPCILCDEADTFLRENDELRGIINSGHRRNGSVLRIVGDDYQPRAFSTYSACAIALIGDLPDTLHDRSVPISLKRRLAKEAITPFRHDQVGHLTVLAKQAARWARDHAAAVGTADPDMPEDVYNREADNWRPLLSIAQAAGGEWPERAREAALASHSAGWGGEDKIAVLLGDIKTLFAEKAKEQLPSSDLAEGLVAIEGRPWAEYGRTGKPISQNQVAKLLRRIGVAPELLREGKKVFRGYQLHRFADAFERYLPPEGAFEPLQRYKRGEIRTPGTFQTVTPEPEVTVAKCLKPSNDGLCNAVTLRRG